MSRLAILLLATGVASCATAPAPSPVPARPSAPPPSFVIANPGFEADFAAGRACPPRWACSAHADGSAFRFLPDATDPAEGKRSLMIERVGNEPWAIVTQSFKAESLRGQRVRFTLSVRTQGVTGDGAGAWLLVRGGSEVLDHQIRRLHGTNGWQRQSIEVVLSPQAEHLAVGGTLEGGGRVWIDDAKLEILGPPAGR